MLPQSADGVAGECSPGRHGVVMANLSPCDPTPDLRLALLMSKTKDWVSHRNNAYSQVVNKKGDFPRPCTARMRKMICLRASIGASRLLSFN